MLCCAVGCPSQKSIRIFTKHCFVSSHHFLTEGGHGYRQFGWIINLMYNLHQETSSIMLDSWS